MKPTLRQRLRYHFDNLMSRGTPAMIGMLFVLSLAVVSIAGAVIALAGFTQDGAHDRSGGVRLGGFSTGEPCRASRAQEAGRDQDCGHDGT